jgi:hypothetical protein
MFVRAGRRLEGQRYVDHQKLAGQERSRRLIKFYAIFKNTEIQRYREFRGFPRKAAGVR